MRLALDTNVLAHAEGVNGSEKRHAALDLVRRLSQSAVVVPVQVLGELFNILVRKAGRSKPEARRCLAGATRFQWPRPRLKSCWPPPISLRIMGSASGMR